MMWHKRQFIVYSPLETESSMALPTDCGRVTGKNEAAGAADARLCHTRGGWACRDRFIGLR